MAGIRPGNDLDRHVVTAGVGYRDVLPGLLDGDVVVVLGGPDDDGARGGVDDVNVDVRGHVAVDPAGCWVANGWSYSKMSSALGPSVVIGIQMLADRRGRSS